MTNVRMVVDGSAPGNGTVEQVPGGWAALLVAEGRERLIGGAIAETTNNRAELIAVLEGLRALRRPCGVAIVTDSTYIHGTLVGGWKRRANHDLLAEIDRLMATHQVSVEIVRGHSGHPENERVDQEARRYAEVAKSAAVVAACTQ